MSGKKECIVCKKSLLAMDAQISEGGNSYHKGESPEARPLPHAALAALSPLTHARAPARPLPPPPQAASSAASATGS